MSLREEFSEPEGANSDTDDIMANIRDPGVWEEGEEEEEGRGGEGVEERVGGGGAGEQSSDFVSVSSLRDSAVTTERERRGRKRPHPTDPEL